MSSVIFTTLSWLLAISLVLLLAVVVDLLTDRSALDRWARRRVRWRRQRAAHGALGRKIWLTACLLGAVPTLGSIGYVATLCRGAMLSSEAARHVVSTIGEPYQVFLLPDASTAKVPDWSVTRWAERMRRRGIDFRSDPRAISQECSKQWPEAVEAMTPSDCWRYAQYRLMESRQSSWQLGGLLIAGVFALVILFYVHRWGIWLVHTRTLRRAWFSLCMCVSIPAGLVAVGSLGALATDRGSGTASATMSKSVFEAQRLAKPLVAIDPARVAGRVTLLRSGAERFATQEDLEQLELAREPFAMEVDMEVCRGAKSLSGCTRSIAVDFDLAERDAEFTAYVFLSATAMALSGIGLYRWGLWLTAASMRRRRQEHPHHETQA